MLGKMFSIDQTCWVANLSLKRRPASLQILPCLSLHIAENQAAGGDTHGGARWQETSHRVDTELASELQQDQCTMQSICFHLTRILYFVLKFQLQRNRTDLNFSLAILKSVA